MALECTDLVLYTLIWKTRLQAGASINMPKLRCTGKALEVFFHWDSSAPVTASVRMVCQRFDQVSFITDPLFVFPKCLEEGSIHWLLAHHHDLLYPEWIFQGWRGQHTRGRPAWPVSVLMTLLLLRASCNGLSRRAAVAEARNHMQWKAAMGLPLDMKPPDERTIRDFEGFLRERLPGDSMPRYYRLHEHIVRLCTESGVVEQDPVWVMDSSWMRAYGAVLDTIRLLGEGLASLARHWGKVQAKERSYEQVVGEWKASWLLAKSIKGGFRVDWRQQSATAEVIDQIAKKAIEVVQGLVPQVAQIRASFRKGLLKRCRQLMRVVEQNLEVDEKGRYVIAQKVARGRMVSMTDPEARHGRKSKSHRFNGFKLHILGDAVSGLIASLSVTPGNQGDGKPAPRLVKRAKDLIESIERVWADSAYGGARLRYEVRKTTRVDLLAPPVGWVENSPRVGIEDFEFDLEEKWAACPTAAVTANWDTVKDSHLGIRVVRFQWEEKDCHQCHLNSLCPVGCSKHRHLTVGPYDSEKQQARRRWAQPETRALYRRRAEGERLVNEFARHGSRRAAAWGIPAATHQAYLIAGLLNLRLLARKLVAKSVLLH